MQSSPGFMRQWNGCAIFHPKYLPLIFWKILVYRDNLTDAGEKKPKTWSCFISVQLVIRNSNTKLFRTYFKRIVLEAIQNTCFISLLEEYNAKCHSPVKKGKSSSMPKSVKLFMFCVTRNKKKNQYTLLPGFGFVGL